MSAMERAAKLVADSNRQMIDTLEERLHDARDSLVEVKQSKEDMGVAMYALQQEVVRMSVKLRESQANVSTLVRDKEMVVEREKMARTETGEWKQKCGKLDKQVIDLKGQVSKSRESIDLLRETTVSLKKSLQAQKISETSYIREVDMLKVQIDTDKEEKEKVCKELERTHKQLKTAHQRTELQEHETKLAQGQLDKIADEMQMLSASRTVAQKQWQAALVAMSKRDKALEEAIKRKDEIEEKYKKLAMVSGGKVDVVGTLRKELEVETQKRIDAEASHNEIKSWISAMKEEAKQAEAALQRYKQREKALSAKLESRDVELNRRDYYITQEKKKVSTLEYQGAEYKGKIEALKNELLALEERRGRALEQNQSKLEMLEAEKEEGKIMAENKHSRLLLERSELKQQVEDLRNKLEESDRWVKQQEQELNEVKTSHVKLEASVLRQTNRANSLSDTLAKEKAKRRTENSSRQLAGGNAPATSGEEEEFSSSDLAVNAASGTRAQLENQRIIVLEQRIVDYQKANKQLKKEIAVLRDQWSKAETGVIKVNQTLSEMKPQALGNERKAQLLSHLHRKATGEIEKLEKEKLDLTLRNDMVHMEQRRANKATHKLKEEKVLLGYQLEEAEAKLRGHQVAQEAEVDALRSSLIAATRANQHVVRQQFTSESQKVVLRGKFEILQRKYQDSSAKLNDANEQIRTLKLKLTRSAKENTELKATLHKMSAASSQLLAREAITEQKRIVGIAIRANNKEKNRPVTDIDGEREDADKHRNLERELRKSITRAATSEEGRVKLQTQLQQEQKRSKRLGKAFMERNEQCRQVLASLDEAEKGLAYEKARGNTAMGIACSLEQQLKKVKKASQFINYAPQFNIKPSKALASALESEIESAMVLEHRGQANDSSESFKEESMRNPTRPQGSPGVAPRAYQRPSAAT